MDALLPLLIQIVTGVLGGQAIGAVLKQAAMGQLPKILSGAIGGLFGAMQGLYFYTITPEQFGFAMGVSVLTTIVLGGRATLAGPIAGALILAVLPEIARPLAENRLFLHGAILLAVIIFVPDGVGDLLVHKLRQRRNGTGRNMIGGETS